MSSHDSIALMNRILSEIGRPDVSVSEMSDDIFDLGLTSIDRLILLTKLEELGDKKIDMAELGTAASLSIEKLVGALDGVT